MEITDIETILLSADVPESKQPRAGGLVRPPTKRVKADMAVLRVHTDEGITGLGEPSPYGGMGNIAQAVEDMKGRFVGEDPTEPDALTRPGLWYGRKTTAGAHRYVLAAVNTACWDILGKATGKPVYKLLGGAERDEVEVYASGGNDWRFAEEPERLVEEAESYLDEGYEAFKFRIGDHQSFVEATRRLHEAVGDEMELIVEGNMRFANVTDAVAMGRQLAEFDPYWFEEPISADDKAGYREIRRALPDVPITGGEMMDDVHELKPYVDDRAYDIVQPDCNIMGISEVKRAAELAHLEGIKCTPHNWHNAINRAANLHVAATLPNLDLLEQQMTWFAGCPTFREDVVKEPLVAEDGAVEVPDRPGLGVELDESVVEAHPYEEGPTTVEWDDHPF
ncbi:mandelate racemase/muconate lactonizing enzyme family protein [Halosimplex amylolyticum]|uniref:mandelate racemase/muconate lactonizing enzyme family protein n=1 Tax=Halosimplex amylolyticum TaxID=3396616 RepID=UPI003F555394